MAPTSMSILPPDARCNLTDAELRLLMQEVLNQSIPSLLNPYHAENRQIDQARQGTQAELLAGLNRVAQALEQLTARNAMLVGRLEEMSVSLLGNRMAKGCIQQLIENFAREAESQSKFRHRVAGIIEQTAAEVHFIRETPPEQRPKARSAEDLAGQVAFHKGRASAWKTIGSWVKWTAPIIGSAAAGLGLTEWIRHVIERISR